MTHEETVESKEVILSHLAFPVSSNTKLVIFDVDGTLYNAAKMRKRMLLELAKYYLFRPHKYKELLILKTFREEREKLADSNKEGIAKLQYQLCAEKLRVSVSEVKKVITKWMLENPLSYLAETKFAYIQELFELLRENNIRIAVYSDYPAVRKLNSLGLKADLVVSADHPEIDTLKPHPGGLQFIMRHFGLKAEDCLMIGDRDDRDGAAAQNVHMPCQLVTNDPESVYLSLIKQLKN